MSSISQLGYVVFGVSDLSRWEDFSEKILGFKARKEESNGLSLRMDDYQQRILLEHGDDDDLRAAGWQFSTIEELMEFIAGLKLKGIDVKEADPEQASTRKVESLFHCEDPNGFRHEFYFGPALSSEPFKSSVLKGSGFKTGLLGIGHLLVRSKEYKESVSFYKKVLGLRVSDHIREEIAPGLVADATFFHTKTGRHHSLATGAVPGDRKLNHFMVEVSDMNDVGLAYDRCVKAGYPIAKELGHHPNDQMFSFYVTSPSGFAIEYGWGGVVIDDQKWQVATYDRLSDWGHKRNMMPS